MRGGVSDGGTGSLTACSGLGAGCGTPGHEPSQAVAFQQGHPQEGRVRTCLRDAHHGSLQERHGAGCAVQAAARHGRGVGIPPYSHFSPSLCSEGCLSDSPAGTPCAESVHEKLLSLFQKAGYEVIYPEVSGYPSTERGAAPRRFMHLH